MYNYRFDEDRFGDIFTASELRSFLEQNREKLIGQKILDVLMTTTMIGIQKDGVTCCTIDTPCIVVLNNFELVIETTCWSEIIIRIAPRMETVREYRKRYRTIAAKNGRHNIKAIGRSIAAFDIETFSHSFIKTAFRYIPEPEGGDYFSRVSFVLDDGSFLNFCAEYEESHGYMDVWIGGKPGDPTGRRSPEREAGSGMGSQESINGFHSHLVKQCVDFDQFIDPVFDAEPDDEVESPVKG